MNLEMQRVIAQALALVIFFVTFIILLVFGIMNRQLFPCKWMDAENAPPKCETRPRG